MRDMQTRRVAVPGLLALLAMCACREVSVGTDESCLTITPLVVDFSLVEGHRGPVSVAVTNQCPGPVTLSGIQMESDPYFPLSGEFGVVGVEALVLPVLLAPGESFTLDVFCSTADDPAHATQAATLIIVPEDPERPALSVQLYGPPVARAGEDQDIEPMPVAPSYLDGSVSSAPGNAVAEYHWTVVDFPLGSRTAAAFNAGQAQEPSYQDAPACPAGQNEVAQPCFIPDTPGPYHFALTVTDVRSICPLASPGDPCDSDADCCSFRCQDTCETTGADGVCRAEGGCAIDSVNVSQVTLRALGTGLVFYLDCEYEADFDLHLVDDLAGRCASGGEACADDSHCQPTDTCDTSGRREWLGAGDCSRHNPRPDFGEPRTTNDASCTTDFDCLEYPPYHYCTGPPGDALCSDTFDDPYYHDGGSCGSLALSFDHPIHAPGPPNLYHLGVHLGSGGPGFDGLVTISAYYQGIEVLVVDPPGTRLSRVIDLPHSFWYAGWLVIHGTDATLIRADMDLYDLSIDGWPPLVNDVPTR